MRHLILLCAAALSYTPPAQQTTPPPVSVVRPAPEVAPPATPEEIAARLEAARMRQEYWTGNADLAVAYLAAHRSTVAPPGRAFEIVSMRAYAATFASALIMTDVGMYRRTFGKYANYAPLETGVSGVVGLNGAFEIESFLTYQALDDVWHQVRNEAVPRERELRQRAREDQAERSAPVVTPADRAFVDTFFREWHVITISHCARWQLNCAQTLLASAKERFPTSADVMIVESALLEGRQERAAALALLRRAVAADPDNVAAQLRLGRLLVSQGRTTEAQPILERALTLARAAHHDASHALALESLAAIDRRAGRTTRARERAAEAASLKAFANQLFAGVPPAEIYRAGQFYEQPRRLAALRELVRPAAAR